MGNKPSSEDDACATADATQTVCQLSTSNQSKAESENQEDNTDDVMKNKDTVCANSVSEAIVEMFTQAVASADTATAPPRAAAAGGGCFVAEAPAPNGGAAQSEAPIDIYEGSICMVDLTDTLRSKRVTISEAALFADPSVKGGVVMLDLTKKNSMTVSEQSLSMGLDQRRTAPGRPGMLAVNADGSNSAIGNEQFTRLGCK